MRGGETSQTGEEAISVKQVRNDGGRRWQAVEAVSTWSISSSELRELGDGQAGFR